MLNLVKNIVFRDRSLEKVVGSKPVWLASFESLTATLIAEIGKQLPQSVVKRFITEAALSLKRMEKLKETKYKGSR